MAIRYDRRLERDRRRSANVLGPSPPTWETSSDLTAVQKGILHLQATAGNAAVAALVGSTAGRERAGDRRHQPAADMRKVRDQVPAEFSNPAQGVQRQAAQSVVYPAYRNVVTAAVRTEMWKAWKETVNSTTPTTRREQGFWIQWDTTSLNNANGRYRAVGPQNGPTMTNDQDAGMTSSPKPADGGDWHTVAAFHTHTPTRYRTTDAAGNPFTSRPAGNSPGDDTAHTTFNVVGIVRDYVGKHGTVPAGHPLRAASKYYHSGPQRRT